MDQRRFCRTRTWIRRLTLVATTGLAVGCGQAEPPKITATSAPAAVSPCPWDPGFAVADCMQSDWWVEFSAHDLGAASMEVEISGSPARTVPLKNRMELSDGFVKFTGGVGGPLPAGTLIRLRASRSGGAGGGAALSDWFGYRVGTPSFSCEGTADPQGTELDGGS